MDTEVISDLKQFISATVGQHSSRLETKIDKLDVRLTNVEGRLSSVEDIVHQMKVTIEDHVFPYISAVDEQVQDHEKRLTRIKA